MKTRARGGAGATTTPRAKARAKAAAEKAVAKAKGWMESLNAPPPLADGFLPPPPGGGAGGVTGGNGVTDPEKLAIARRLVRAGGSGTAEDVDAVVSEVQKFPVPILKQLERQRTTIAACRGSVPRHIPAPPRSP